MLIKVLFYSVFSAVALFIFVKFMGEKQISQMNMFDYITGITIGSIAAEMAAKIGKVANNSGFDLWTANKDANSCEYNTPAFLDRWLS